MAWIEYHEQLRDHIKVWRLSKLLSCDYPTALGYLGCLWLWAVGNARDGKLADFSDDEIAYGARYAGPSSEFVKHLLDVRWLNQDKTIHDWKAHGTRLLDEARERVRKHRSSDVLTSKTSPRRGERGGVVPKVNCKRESKKEREKEGKRVERYGSEQKRNSNVSAFRGGTEHIASVIKRVQPQENR